MQAYSALNSFIPSINSLLSFIVTILQILKLYCQFEQRKPTDICTKHQLQLSIDTNFSPLEKKKF